MDITWLTSILVGAGCLALGYFIGAQNSARMFLSTKVTKDTAGVDDGKKQVWGKQPLEIEKLAEILEDF